MVKRDRAEYMQLRRAHLKEGHAGGLVDCPICQPVVEAEAETAAARAVTTKWSEIKRKKGVPEKTQPVSTDEPPSWEKLIPRIQPGLAQAIAEGVRLQSPVPVREWMAKNKK